MGIALPPLDTTPETWPQGVRQGPPNWPDAPAGTGEMPEFPERAPERKDDLFLDFMDSVLMPLSLMRIYIRSITLMPQIEELGEPVIDETRRTVCGRVQAFLRKVETGRDFYDGANLFFLKEAVIGLAERGVPRGLIPTEARELIGDLEDPERPTGVDTDFRYRPRNPEHVAFWKTLEPWTFARVFWDDLAGWYSGYDMLLLSELEFTEGIEQNTVAAALAVLYAMDPRLSPERNRCKFMPSVFYSDLDRAEPEPDEPSDSPFTERVDGRRDGFNDSRPA
jgi:hypothetical protein